MSTNITVHWEAVDCIDHNGEIIGYSLRYRGNGSAENISVSGNSDGGKETITGLSAAMLYTVEVAAETSAGTGVYSDPLTVETAVSSCKLLQLLISELGYKSHVIFLGRFIFSTSFEWIGQYMC